MKKSRHALDAQGRRTDRRREGAALAEYGLLLAGLTLASMVAVSVLGGKVGGMIASVATLLPGATAADNAPVQVGRLIETQTIDSNGDGTFEQVISAQALEQNASRPSNRMGSALNMQGHEVGHLYQLGDQSLHR
jgi:Flp pilus assembly pilin Flp